MGRVQLASDRRDIDLDGIDPVRHGLQSGPHVISGVVGNAEDVRVVAEQVDLELLPELRRSQPHGETLRLRVEDHQRHEQPDTDRRHDVRCDKEQSGEHGAHSRRAIVAPQPRSATAALMVCRGEDPNAHVALIARTRPAPAAGVPINPGQQAVKPEVECRSRGGRAGEAVGSSGW